jgi:hypothetical protein
MDSHVESAMSADDEVAAPASQPGDVSPEESDRLLRSSADDELLDEFWRRRFNSGHH